MLTLCKQCNSANANGFAAGPCYICGNSLDRLDSMIEESIKKIDNTTNFSISTIIPSNWLLREEVVWNKKFSNVESIKNSVNRKIVASLTKTNEKKYSPENGEIRIVFDFGSSTVKLESQPLFIFGRYKKYSRELSQSRWGCKKCEGEGCFKCDYTGKNYTSIEELIGEPFKTASDCDEYSLHASGREDVDVINTAGRPFVLELKNPKNKKIDLTELSEEVNNENIEISDIKFVWRGAVELVANSHFDKVYEAVVSFEKEIPENIIEKINSLAGITVEQKTPTRVAHRRADLLRKKRILSVEIVERKKQGIVIRIEAEAGTYIKEFINGDKGRTKPSITEVIGVNAKCEELRVIAIYDEFLKVRGL